ncbi:hypothetical protein F4703DRAFT_1827258 [Phycomyces blakesleeanus]
MSSDALKLFWPSHICTPNNRRGFLIGWYNSHNTICVVFISYMISRQFFRNSVDQEIILNSRTLTRSFIVLLVLLLVLVSLNICCSLYI